MNWTLDLAFVISAWFWFRCVDRGGTVGEGVSDRATLRCICRRTSTQYKSGTKRKEEDNVLLMKMTCHTRFIESVYNSTCHVVFTGAVESANGLVYSREHNTDVRSIVPKAPVRSTSPMPRHFIIVDPDVAFPLPNSRLCHN